MSRSRPAPRRPSRPTPASFPTLPVRRAGIAPHKYSDNSPAGGHPSAPPPHRGPASSSPAAAVLPYLRLVRRLCMSPSASRRSRPPARPVNFRPISNTHVSEQADRPISVPGLQRPSNKPSNFVRSAPTSFLHAPLAMCAQPSPVFIHIRPRTAIILVCPTRRVRSDISGTVS